MIITGKSCDDFLDAALLGSTAGETYKSIIVYREEMKDMVAQKSIIKGGDFIDCGLAGTVFDESELSEVTFKLCDMQGATFAGCKLKHVRFVDCKMDDIDFSSVDMQHCSFLRCDGSIITEGGDLTDVTMDYCDIQDSNLSSTAMFDVIFRNSNLCDTSFEESYGMQVTFEKTSIEGSNMDWAAVNVLETDGYTDASYKPSKKDITRRMSRVVSTVCHNAVLITG
jgi:uncharacterized protein YjbI with pentapeptide repeats